MSAQTGRVGHVRFLRDVIRFQCRDVRRGDDGYRNDGRSKNRFSNHHFFDVRLGESLFAAVDQSACFLYEQTKFDRKNGSEPMVPCTVLAAV